MTLVCDSLHVASLLRINLSKLGCALQANFIYAIALTSLRSSGSISLNSVAPYRLISCYAIALTSLHSSGSISLSSVATSRLTSLRASSVYSFFPNGKNCIHCSRIRLRPLDLIHFTLQPSHRFAPQDQYL